MPIFEGQFWINAIGNFLDICVLEWCKLFGEKRGKHYWREIISDPDSFFQELLNETGLTETEFYDLNSTTMSEKCRRNRMGVQLSV